MGKSNNKKIVIGEMYSNDDMDGIPDATDYIYEIIDVDGNKYRATCSLQPGIIQGDTDVEWSTENTYGWQEDLKVEKRSIKAIEQFKGGK